MEEGDYEDLEKELSRRVQILIALFGFVVLFTIFCSIIWGASKPFKAKVLVKSLTVSNVYVGEGSDFSGVPTKMLTVNGSLIFTVHNPASIFYTPINLLYSDISVPTGQLKKYCQPRKSSRTVSVILSGTKVPLYGAGSSLMYTQTGALAPIPLTLNFQIKSRGYVVGHLVETKHIKEISCPLVAILLSPNLSSSKRVHALITDMSCTFFDSMNILVLAKSYF